MIDGVGLKILLVEDEALIAMMAEDMVEGLGHSIRQTASTVTEALGAVAEDGFDVALLDVNLNGDNSMPVATALKERGRPFAFTTGYGSNGAAAEHGDVPVLTKPYSLTQLEAMLARLSAQLAGTSSTTSVSDSNLG